MQQNNKTGACRLPERGDCFSEKNATDLIANTPLASNQRLDDHDR